MDNLSGQPAPQVSLRLATWDDVPAMYEIGADPVACEMAGVKPRTREAFEARWREVLADPKIHARVIEVVEPTATGGSANASGQRAFAGSISVFQAPGETRDSIGYWLARPFWGLGIASRALAMFLSLEPRRPLHATASMSNVASQRVMLKNGFRLVRRYRTEETERLMARETGEFILD